MNVTIIANRVRKNAETTTSGEITHRCGHAVRYSATSAFGFGMVAAMTARADCDECCRVTEAWVEEIGPTLANRQAAFENAVTARNAEMKRTGKPIHDPEISELQANVLRAVRLLDEAKSASELLRERA